MVFCMNDFFGEASDVKTVESKENTTEIGDLLPSQNSITASEDDELVENDEKELQASKNSFLLFDEERSDEESTTSSLRDFIDDKSQTSDCDSSSTVSSMGHPSSNSEIMEESTAAVLLDQEAIDFPPRVDLKLDRCDNCKIEKQFIMRTVGTQTVNSLATAKSRRHDQRKSKSTTNSKKRKRILVSSDESECERVVKRQKIVLVSTDDEL